MIGAMLLHLPSASTFSWDIDQLVLWVTILTGFWFFAAEGMFFWLLWRFRARDGVKSRYITGKEPELKRWINIPHTIILVFDIVIIVMAVRVWVKVKQTMPPADDTVRIVTQQWTWSFQHSGPDGVLDTADDVWTSDTLHVAVGKTYHFMLESIGHGVMGGRIAIETPERHAAWMQAHAAMADAGVAGPDSTAAPASTKN